MKELAKLGSLLKLVLTWNPGHMRLKGNEQADELARAWSSSNDHQLTAIGKPLGVVKRDIIHHCFKPS